MPSTPFGRYLLIEKIATGGMAEIFLAKLLGAEGFEKKVVVKRILPAWAEDREFVEMLIDEAKLTVELTHANIVQVYELVREGEMLGIAMEYLPGIDLRRLIQRVGGRLPLEVSLTIITELLSGLAYAHQKADDRGRPLGIVHRDISPQNILLSRDGSVKIADFGIARAASRSHETMAGVLKGKLAYMSPEQASQESIDHRSDLFSVGILLYELVTGERLFGRGSDLETLDRVRRAQIGFSPGIEGSFPRSLKEILLKSLARRPDDRYPDATAFRQALLGFVRRSRRKLSPEKIASLVQAHLGNQPSLSPTEPTPHSPETVPLPELAPLPETRLLSRSSSAMSQIEATAVIPSRPHPRRGRGWGRVVPYAIPLLAAVGFGIFLFFRPSGGETISRPSSNPMTGLLIAPTVTSAVPPAEPAEESFPAVGAGQILSPVSIPLPPSKPTTGSPASIRGGYLNIQAIPWGYVTVAGRGPLETPIRRLQLAEGNHRLSVLYEPDGTRLTSNVTIEEGGEITCIADFKDRKGIRCR